MRTVNGFVYAFGSSSVMSISSLPKIGRRKRSVNFAWPLYGLPLTSSHPSYGPSSAPRRLLVSTTSVSPSQRPTE